VVEVLAGVVSGEMVVVSDIVADGELSSVEAAADISVTDGTGLGFSVDGAMIKVESADFLPPAVIKNKSNIIK
jgi:hypothetical protein